MDSTDRSNDLVEHALEFRQSRRSVGRVGHPGCVTNLRDRKEALILRIVLGDTVEQVDVLDGRQTLGVEPLEPPQLEPLGHHPVEVPIGAVLGVAAALERSEGEVEQRGNARGCLRCRDGAHNPSDRPAREVLVEEDIDAGTHLVRSPVFVRPHHVHINDHVLVRRDLLDLGGDFGESDGQLGPRARKGKQVHLRFGVPIPRRHQGSRREFAESKVLEVSDAVVAARDHLEHCLLGGKVVVG